MIVYILSKTEWPEIGDPALVLGVADAPEKLFPLVSEIMNKPEWNAYKDGPLGVRLHAGEMDREGFERSAVLVK